MAIHIENTTIIDGITEDQLGSIAKVLELLELGNQLIVNKNGKKMLLKLVEINTEVKNEDTNKGQ
ncbi:MAG: hypothetical protein ACRC6O_13470 [Flavobacterium sp.]